MINRLDFWCHPILPLVYEDSLSYYEVLCKTQTKVNELIEVFNGFSGVTMDELEARINDVVAYVDAQNGLDKAYVDSQIRVSANRIYEEIQALKLENNSSIEELKNRIAKLRTDITKLVSDLRYDLFVTIENKDAMWHVEFEKYKKEINNLIKDLNVLVVNPVNGLLEDINVVVRDIWNELRTNAIEAIHFDALGLTAEEYDTISITARDFDLDSNTILSKPLCRCFMMNPYSGLITSIDSVIAEVITNISEGITCSYFESLNWTVNQIQNKDFTAYDFDFTGRFIFV